MDNPFKKFDLTGKTALVTGGASGIGYFMTRALVSSGAKVMIVARREGVLKDAAEKLSAEYPGREIQYYPVDLSDNASIDNLSRHALDTLGGIDIFVGNAAQISFEPLESIKDQTLEQMLQVNVAANVKLSRAFLPHMRANRWGRVIFSSSVASIHGDAESGTTIYSTIKGALNAFVHAAAAECGHDAITFNSIVLGPFLTEMWQGMLTSMDREHGAGTGESIEKKLTSMIALGRMAQCEEIEGVIQLLASEAGSFITGSNLAVDGGQSIMMQPHHQTV